MNKVPYVPIEDLDQSGPRPYLTRDFAVQSGWADAQADLSLGWSHMLQ